MKTCAHYLLLVNKYKVYNSHTDNNIWHNTCCWEWWKLRKVSLLSYQPNFAKLILMKHRNVTAYSASYPGNIL